MMVSNFSSFANRCLILEDNPARYPYLINLTFEIAFPLVERLIIVTTSKTAIEELSRFSKWNVIMLDHDLDGKTYVNSDNPNTGYQVAKFIKEHEIKYTTCIVHSLNDVGAKKMMNILKDTGHCVYKPCVDL